MVGSSAFTTSNGRQGGRAFAAGRRFTGTSISTIEFRRCRRDGREEPGWGRSESLLLTASNVTLILPG